MRRLHCLACALLAAPLLAAPLAAQRPQFISADSTMPFSQSVRVGNTIYLSGMIGTEGSALVPGGIGPETRRTLEHIRSALERHGATLEDVVKCTVFLADIGEWAAMNQVYVTFFPRQRPARSALGANGLALGARVEIECLAVTSG